jgi:cell wall-associated NlpC family hydrolase
MTGYRVLRAGAGPPRQGRGRAVVFALVAAGGLAIGGLLVGPVLMFASGGLLTMSDGTCPTAPGSSAGQPPGSQAAQSSIPANYLAAFRQAGTKYGVPWVILAGIGKVESDDGRTSLPGVHSGANPFGAAGPMQIGIGGAAGNQWGGAPVHPASEQVAGVATDANGDGTASVYDPADAIAGAAKYLVEHGLQSNVPGAIFAYNHLPSYVQLVLQWAGTYTRGGFTVQPVSLTSASRCLPASGQPPGAVAAAAIAFAQAQLGKPYQWGGTGPDSFDCSGLVMMAYRAAGLDIPRTSQQQFAWGPRISPQDAEPGDLVFFAGADGTVRAPGHVGIVIGHGMMIEAFATGFPIRIAPYTGRDPVGFTRPWAHGGQANTAAHL